MRAINTAHQRPNKTTAELRVPQVFHFVYACKLAGLINVAQLLLVCHILQKIHKNY